MSSSVNPEAREGGGGPALLMELLRRELASIPIAQWGYLFPGHVAVWRFIEAERPGVLGELAAGYDKEPYFKGRGSDWFCGTLGNQNDYLTPLEQIMYSAVGALSSEAKERGFLLETEVPPLDSDAVHRLARAVLSHVDHGTAQRAIR